MNDPVSKSITILGGCPLVGHAALKVKARERTVIVKGLSEREVPADIAIWPLTFQEATRNARSVAEKFAADSESKLGEIRSAQQGQYCIENRDSTTPQIKRVRVVSTVEYYLAD